MFKTVYHQLSRDLEKYFREGSFPEYLPGIRQLCKQFNVSKNTVSKALHELEKRGVIIIEPQRGLKLNRARTRYSIRFHTIGVAGICGLEPQEFLDILNRKYRKYGFSLMGLQISGSAMRNREWLLRLPVDGMILLNSASHPYLLDLFYANGMPLVGCPVPGYDHLVQIEPDHYAAYCNIFRKLMNMGHRRIATVHFEPDPAFDFYIKRIYKAMQDVLQKHFDPELFCLIPSEEQQEFFEDNGRSLCRRLFDKFMTMQEPPTVIVAEQTKLHLFREFYELRGYKVPDDISMYAIQYPLNRDPFFSAAVLREDHSVEIAVRKMIAMLNGKEVEPGETLIPMSFFSGRSVKDLTVQ